VKNAKTPMQRSIRRHLIVGLATVALLAGGVGGWAFTTEIAGAVIAPGFLVVDTNVKKVQHPTGGIVGQLFVRDGQRVKAGDLVVRLDDTIVRANLAIVAKSLDELTARQARLEAERDDGKNPAFPPDLLARRSDPDLERVLAGEQRLFELRRTARFGQVSQLKEQITQLKEQISGLQDQAKAKTREIDLITQELKGVLELWRKNLVQVTRLTALERDAARLEGERGALISSIAQTKGKVTETELKIIQIDQDMRTEVGKELAEIRAKLSELSEKRVSAEDQLKRIDMRAPQDGMVHQLSIHTIGGVITQGEPIMLIVPEADELTVEARVEPQKIDQLHFGQTAILRFSAFNQRTTPEIKGRVTRISADLIQDQKSGVSFYTIRISMSPEEVKRLGEHRLIPGMPVEAFLQTADRTVISYLLKPLQDQIMRAFREI
jgi:HlyD family secretion protein